MKGRRARKLDQMMRIMPAAVLVYAGSSAAFFPRYPASRAPCGNIYAQQQRLATCKSAEDDENDSDSASNKLFDDMTRDLLGGGTSPNPFASGLKRLGKGDIYGDDELMSILLMHERLSLSYEAEIAPNLDNSPSQSLHDLVLGSIGTTSSVDMNKGNDPSGRSRDAFRVPTFSTPLLTDADSDTKEKIRKIRAIAADVDGTLLSSRQTLHPRTRMAVKRAIHLSSEEVAKGDGKKIDFFFPATGKSRKGALDSLGIEIGSLIAEGDVPGVYIQGLYCVDGKGNVVFEKKLTAEATSAAEKLVKETGVSIVAYDGDDLYTTEPTDIVVHLHEHYGEPLPQLLPTFDKTVKNLSQHAPCMHKLLLMDNDTERLMNTVRPQLEALAEQHDACVTQALPTMLEFLPAGCSKALGVTKLCSALGIDMETELLALGDAENDAEMLELAAIGVAMGNGCPLAKEAADFVLDETNDEGGAGVAMELFAFEGLI